jgi:energy-coupling factor transport system ATP-binding protein
VIEVRSVVLAAPGSGAVLVDVGALFIRRNEYISLIGPNGAGKSLLLQLLAGLRPPTAGEIAFDESNGSGRRAIVFQNPDDQIVGSTVERDLAFGLENREVEPAEIRRRVDEALEWSGLAPSARRPPHLLSEGEKQRLALAAALLLEPDLLLLDEPTSRLDPPARRRFLEEVHRFRARSGATIVQVSHRSEEILPAERVVGMRAGRIVFDGSSAELLASGDADRLGIVWSDLHGLRRALARRGAELPACRGEEWNRAEPLVESLR